MALQSSIFDDIFYHFYPTNYQTWDGLVSNVDYNKIVEDNSVTYEIAFPGFTKDELKIETKADEVCTITITAEKPEDKNKKYNLSSIKRKHAYKLFVDEKVFDLEKTKAKMENGILFITIPKKEEKIPKKYEIKID